jgi:hypothetical protein
MGCAKADDDGGGLFAAGGGAGQLALAPPKG